MKLQSRPPRLVSASALALLLSVSSTLTHAATTLTWATGAAGTWDTTTNTAWTPGPVVWNNSNNDTAIFNGGAGYTVSLDGPITVGGIEINTTSGNFLIQSSTLTLAGGTAPTVKVTDVGALVTISSAITGSSGLTKTGSGGLQLSNASNNYTGATTLNGGSLRIGITNGLSTAASLTMTSGTFEMQGNSQSVTALTGSGTIRNRATGTSVFTVTGSSTATYAGALNDAGSGKTLSFKLAGTGAVQTLSNAGNTYSGPTTVSAGTLVAGTNSLASSIAANSSVTVNSTTDLITLTGNTLSNGDEVIFSGTTMPTGVTTGQPGTRYFVINKSGNTFQVSATSGGAAIDLTTNGTSVAVSHYITGAFGIGNSAIILGDAATTTNNSSASLLTGGAFTIGRAVTIANQATSGTYRIGGNTANTSAFTGAVTANQSLTVSQVADGTLNISGGITGASAGTKTVTFNNVGAVNINTTGISDGATGNVAVTQSGAGTTTLNAASTYTGNTTISAGTLALGASGTFANSPVINLGTSGSQGTLNLTAKSAFTFGSGQTVSGYGAINIGSGKTVTIDGTLAPGNGTGIVTVTGDLTLGSASITNLEIVGRNNGAPVAGTDFDRVAVVSGALTFGGTLNLNTAGLTGLVAGDSFNLFTAGSYNSGLTSVAMTGDYTASFTGNSGIWIGTDAGLDFTFTEANGILSITTSAVPEPSTCATLAGVVILGFAALRRRRIVR